ncbi:hypothetical protein ES332_D01G235400v1 [Gossypium tomentosum]|nr:hypothetical protein ES332_D01G235400v1 [Gossypium tomentosum]
MKISEPALVPEWLRTSGTTTGGINSVPHFASSSSNTDASSLVHHGRHRNSRNISDFDFSCLAILDRSSSMNSWRSCSNGSAKHAYSTFKRSSFGNHWARDSSNPLGSILTSKVEKLGGILTSRDEIYRLWCSNSMIYGKQGEPLHQRTVVDSKDSGINNHYDGNGLLCGGTFASTINKFVFEKDFPSLGTKEKQGVSEIARVSSPTLAEVPSVDGSSGTGSLPASLIVSTSGSGSPSVTAGLNMTEALTQAPSRTHTIPRLSVKTQRCEELAIKQSRQLIPVTPSMPKGLVHNSVDKSKAKPAIRTSDMNITIKSGQQQYSLTHHGNQSPHSDHIKSDMPKTSGKLLVLKPGWENGVSSPTHKDVASPTTNMSSRGTTSQHAVAPVTSASSINSKNQKLSAGERKASTLNPVAGFTVEKKPSLAQTQNWNDFFNLLKKKTSMNSAAGLANSDPHNSSSTTEKSEVSKEVVTASAPACANENHIAATSNGGTRHDAKRFSDDGENYMTSTSMVYPDEEEAAFLRSLGWEENSGEDEGLTKEIINAFYQEYMKLRPSLKLCSSMLPKLAHTFATNLDGASEPSSSDSVSEACLSLSLHSKSKEVPILMADL